MVGTRRDKGDAGMQLDDVTERERGAFTRHGGASRIRLRTREGITHTVYTRRSQREKILDEEELLLLLLRSNHGGHQGADLIISLREGRYFLPSGRLSLCVDAKVYSSPLFISHSFANRRYYIRMEHRRVQSRRCFPLASQWRSRLAATSPR